MADALLILISAVLVNNFVLAKFLGICPFLGVSARTETAVGMSLAVLFVLTLASAISWIVEHLLLAPLGLSFLRTIAFILVIAALVQFIETMMKKTAPVLHQALGIFLPLITTNCAVLGVAILNVQKDHGFLQSVVYGFGAALGFALVLVLFSAMRERIAQAPVGRLLEGAPIALIAAGLMSLAFMGFSGLVTVE